MRLDLDSERWVSRHCGSETSRRGRWGSLSPPRDDEDRDCVRVAETVRADPATRRRPSGQSVTWLALPPKLLRLQPPTAASLLRDQNAALHVTSCLTFRLRLRTRSHGPRSARPPMSRSRQPHVRCVRHHPLACPRMRILAADNGGAWPRCVLSCLPHARHTTPHHAYTCMPGRCASQSAQPCFSAFAKFPSPSQTTIHHPQDASKRAGQGKPARAAHNPESRTVCRENRRGPEHHDTISRASPPAPQPRVSWRQAARRRQSTEPLLAGGSQCQSQSLVRSCGSPQAQPNPTEPRPSRRGIDTSPFSSGTCP